MTQPSLPTIVLASGSPRRREFLSLLGLPYSVQVANIDETPRPNELPTALAQRLAEQKALAVAAKVSDPVLVIAADTVVALGNDSLGKPGSVQEATQMLQQLRNQTHQVITALSLLHTISKTQKTRVSVTNVHMRNYSDREIADYIASGDPFDKAGGYAIQHPDFAPVTRIDGCLSTVIGLPLGELSDLLQIFGVAITCPLAPICQQQMPFHCCRVTI